MVVKVKRKTWGGTVVDSLLAVVGETNINAAIQKALPAAHMLLLIRADVHLHPEQHEWALRMRLARMDHEHATTGCTLTHYHTHLLTYSPTHLLTYSPTHLLTCSPAHLLTYSHRLAEWHTCCLA